MLRMLGSLLNRMVLWEAARLTAFYGVMYMALVTIALVAPLLESGAPLWSILMVLPNQLLQLIFPIFRFRTDLFEFLAFLVLLSFRA